LRYVSCSSTGAKVGMRKAIIRNAAARSLTAEAKIALEPCEAREGDEDSYTKGDGGRCSALARSD
jgi:hypothetical protein